MTPFWISINILGDSDQCWIKEKKMTPKTIERNLLDHNSGKAFISITCVRMWLGIGQNKAEDLLEGLHTLDGKYFIPDVANRICERSAVK